MSHPWYDIIVGIAAKSLEIILGVSITVAHVLGFSGLFLLYSLLVGRRDCVYNAIHPPAVVLLSFCLHAMSCTFHNTISSLSLFRPNPQRQLQPTCEYRALLSSEANTEYRPID
jgi:hypothetical protein